MDILKDQLPLSEHIKIEKELMTMNDMTSCPASKQNSRQEVSKSEG